MSGAVRALTLLVALAVMATGCANDKVVSRTTTESSLGYERVPGQPGDAAGGSGAGIATTRPPVRRGPYSASNPPPVGFREADLAVAGSVPLTMRITPGCVEHGRPLEIAARSRKGIYIRMSVLLPNDQFSDVPTHAATAGGSGIVTWSLKITDEARTGEAQVQASARDPDSGQLGTSGTWEFVVAAPGGCAA